MDFIRDYLKAQGLSQSEIQLMSEQQQQHVYDKQRARDDAKTRLQIARRHLPKGLLCKP